MATFLWVGAKEAPPPHDNDWHLQWKNEITTLCGEDNELYESVTIEPKTMGDSPMAEYICETCAEQFQRIVYWKIEHGENLEVMKSLTSFIDHLKNVTKKDDAPSTVEAEPVGPFEYEDTDGTVYEYDYDDKVIMKRGDYRKNGIGQSFFVPLEALPEFDFHDETITDDQDFWDWFDGFIEKHHLKPTRQQSTRAVVKASDWGFGKTETKKHLSDWWGGSSWFSPYKGNKTRQMAVALQAVQSTIRVVDTHERRLRVQLADTDVEARIAAEAREGKWGPTSATDFGSKNIYVSAAALADDKIELGDGIDITTGFALHEASHAQYSEANFHAIDQPTRLMPLAVSGFLFNIAEDMRIEGLTSDVFPGFADYFDKTLDYMWKEFVSKSAPAEWGPDLEAKLNAIVSMVKWPVQYEPIARADSDLDVEFDWWNQWAADFVSGKVSARKTLTNAMERLASDPETKKEMDEQAGKEAKAELDKKNIAEALKKASEMMEGLIKGCSSMHGEHDEALDKGAVNADEAVEINNYAESEYREESTMHTQIPNGSGKPEKIVSMHPTETERSRSQYQPPNSALVAKMRAAFLLRPSAMEWTDRLRKGGTIDEDEIWRGGMSDPRMFEQRYIESAPDTAIALLIDQSGSMSGEKLEAAVQAATIVHHCVKDMPGVSVRAYSHTGDSYDSGRGSAVVYRLWEKGEPLSRLGIALDRQRANNYDGYAIGHVVEDLMKHSTPDQQQLLFVFSDGLPAGGGWSGGSYGGGTAMEHVRSVVDWAARKGVDVIQVAIDPYGLDEEDQRRMFKHYVMFDHSKGLEALPGQIVNILKRVM